MSHEIEAHIAAVEVTYRALVAGPSSRLTGGAHLWGQFEDAAAAYRRHGRTQLAHFIRRSLARVVKGGDEAVGLA